MKRYILSYKKLEEKVDEIYSTKSLIVTEFELKRLKISCNHWIKSGEIRIRICALTIRSELEYIESIQKSSPPVKA